jgi:type IV secretion system protein TrbJ
MLVMRSLLLKSVAALTLALVPNALQHETVQAGTVAGFGGSTEFTQIANNVQLASIQLKNIQQVANQIAQINNQITQIMNQVRMYTNMIQNTANLPSHIWGNVVTELNALRSTINQGRSLAYNLTNIDTVVSNRFKDYATFKGSPLDRAGFDAAYSDWSKTNSDTIGAALKTAGMQESQFASEEATLNALQGQAMSADGQHKALQVANQIAVQQVQQMQKLRQLVMSQMSMQAAFNAKISAQTDVQMEQQQRLQAPGATVRNTGTRY